MKDINISIEELSIGSKRILTASEIKIANGMHYGIIGKNGEGKTTILKFINDNEQLTDVGKFYVCQETIVHDTDTVFNTILESNTKLYTLHILMQELQQTIASYSGDDLDQTLFDKYTQTEEGLFVLGYEKECAIIRRILVGLGFPQQSHCQPTNTFSGGWRMRIALACALYRSPDLLLLDEPTNHLDLEANIWLNDFLKDYSKTLIIVSHDVDLLENVCTHMVHLENQTLSYYRGGYYKYKKAYDAKIRELTKTATDITKKVKEMRKSGKQKKELEAFLKKNPVPFIPYNKNIIIDFGKVPSNYKNLITLESVSFVFNPCHTDEHIVLDNIDISISTKTRISLVGKNGSGKSTLMKLLHGRLSPTSQYQTDFTKVSIDSRIKIGYLDQHTHEYLPCNKTPIDYLMGISSEISAPGKNITSEEARSCLGKIGLESITHNLNISQLSGGQKVRIVLAELQMKNVHLLLLDEPTNNLDLPIIEALKDGINSFDGGVVLISHNIDLIVDTKCDIYELINHKCIKTSFDEYCKKIIG